MIDLLLISNSTMVGEKYLEYTIPYLKDFILPKKVNKALFIPFAGVTFSYDDYEAKVKQAFAEIPCEIESIHHADDYQVAIKQAEMIVVGGGNTWQLLLQLQKNQLIECIQKKVNDGTPYIGWSAGSNMACPTVKTTNDMPIVQPVNFNALGFVRFQINPHYLDANPDGHGGETREDRIREFLELNAGTTVVGLREGTMLKVKGEELELLGNRSMRVFKKDTEPRELQPNARYDFLLKQNA